jgi:hypothetical protein
MLSDRPDFFDEKATNAGIIFLATLKIAPFKMPDFFRFATHNQNLPASGFHNGR